MFISILCPQYPDEDGSPRLTPSVSRDGHNLVSRLLTRDPKLRLRSIMTLEIVPFFKGFKFSEVRSKKVSPKQLLEDLTPSKSEPKPPDIQSNQPKPPDILNNELAPIQEEPFVDF
ncbi:hypothetical protein M8J77_015108 [Diaphorina citri]|nr:hypothetical protein M8J77_015108 [Diaphorina citri]